MSHSRKSLHTSIRLGVMPLILFCVCFINPVNAQRSELTAAEYFAIALVGSEEVSQREARRWIRDNWSEDFLPYFAEVYQFGAQFEGGAALRDVLIDNIGRRRAGKMETFLQHLWNLEIPNRPNYSVFKQWIHQTIDPRFATYFDPSRKALIRLDEITWGGVVQDGIPPLRDPKMLKATDADYLEDEHIVFGISINGDPRAYPKRILA